MKKSATALKVISEEPEVLEPLKQTSLSGIHPVTVEETLHEAYRMLVIVQFWLFAKDKVAPSDFAGMHEGMIELLMRATYYVKAVTDALPFEASEIAPWKTREVPTR